MKKKLSKNAMESRNVAKFLGGKALKGTKRQKEWAEKIRAGKLKEMNEESAILICDPQGICTHSKFWIENRDKGVDDFNKFISTQKNLLARYKQLREKAFCKTITNEENEILLGVVDKYNALTSIWFKECD